MAMSKPARAYAASGQLDRIYPSLQRIPIVGSTVIPDPEQVLRLRPDAVFVYAGQDDVLKKTGLPGVIATTANPKDPIGSRKRIWRAMGGAVGNGARVAALLDRYAAKIAALHKCLPQDKTRRRRVVYVHANQGDWMVTNDNYYMAYKMELAGAENLSKSSRISAKADLEQLMVMDPDVILFASNTDDKTTLQEIVGRPEFEALRAVRERRIYKFPEHSFMNELVEDPILLTWMAEIFYPDTMPRRLREKYKETYQEIYHYAISDDEIDKAIYLEENRHSAGYERFVR